MSQSPLSGYSRMLLGVAILPTLVACGSDKDTPRHDPLPRSELQRIVAEASAARASDLRSLVRRGRLGLGSSLSDQAENMPLTLVLLDLSTGPFASPAMREEFGLLAESSQDLLGGIPRPDKWDETTAVNLVRPEDVEKLACEVSDDRAEGTVAIEREDLLRAKVQFSARLVQGRWQIEEFRLPACGLRTTRQSSGRWQVTDTKPHLRRPVSRLSLQEQDNGHTTRGFARVLLLAGPPEKARRRFHETSLEMPIRIMIRPTGRSYNNAIYEVEGIPHVMSSPEELGKALRARAASAGQVPVIIRPRADVRWQWVVQACWQAQRAKVGLVTIEGARVRVELVPENAPSPLPGTQPAMTVCAVSAEKVAHHRDSLLAAEAKEYWIDSKRFGRPSDGLQEELRARLKTVAAKQKTFAVEVDADIRLAYTWLKPVLWADGAWGMAGVSETPGGTINPGSSVPSDSGKTDSQLRIIGSAAGGSSGETLAPFGHTTGGRGAGPRSNFFGRGGNAHHICYAIDRSGSMGESFDRVRHEMLLSIARLRPKQDFHVILFAKGVPQEAASRKLVPAIPRNKEKAAKFLDDIRAAGQTDPIPALRCAFDVLAKADRRRPGKLLYLLTDGEFVDNKAVLALIRERNAKKDVHINTYLYNYRGEKAVAVMKQIAEENGGRFTQIEVED